MPSIVRMLEFNQKNSLVYTKNAELDNVFIALLWLPAGEQRYYVVKVRKVERTTERKHKNRGA